MRHIPLLCVQLKTPGDGQRNCPKHVEFYSKNKSEKLVYLVSFIIRIYHDVQSPERQMGFDSPQGHEIFTKPYIKGSGGSTNILCSGYQWKLPCRKVAGGIKLTAH